MVTRILHPTAYKPMVKACSHVVGRKWAPLPAVIVTFAVSALMHKLIFYYLTHEKGAWEALEHVGICIFFSLFKSMHDKICV
jgi:hypothetical protein